MSAIFCPSCLAKQYENGCCAKCGFAGAEYKAAKTALTMGTVIGKYQIGVMKSTSRQSQIYTAVHTETSVPVILEEFFPNKTAGRVPNGFEVALTNPNDSESAHRYEQAQFLIEASNQKRPLKRIDVVRANNTIYSIFEAVPSVSVATQCEMMADNPYYFRDQDGKPTMTINALEIPPMPDERAYVESRDPLKAPITTVAEPMASNPVVEEVEQQTKKRKSKALIAIIAAIVLLAGGLVGADAAFHFLGIIPKPTEEEVSPTPEEPTVSVTPEETATEEPPEETATPEPEPTETPIPELAKELSGAEFNEQLKLISMDGEEEVFAFKTNGSDADKPGQESESIRLEELQLQVSEGLLLRETPGVVDNSITKYSLYMVARKNDQAADDNTYYWIPVGFRVLTEVDNAGTTSASFALANNNLLLGFDLWRNDYAAQGYEFGKTVVFAEENEGDTWLRALWAKEAYRGDKYVQYSGAKFHVEPVEEEMDKDRAPVDADSAEAQEAGENGAALQDDGLKLQLVLTVTNEAGMEIDLQAKPLAAAPEEKEEEPEPPVIDEPEEYVKEIPFATPSDLVGCLRLITAEGVQLEKRELKSGYVRITDDDTGALKYTEAPVEELVKAVNGELLIPSKRGTVMYMVVTDGETDYRTQVAKQDKNKAYSLPGNDDKGSELVLKLDRNFGYWDEGTLLHFDCEENGWVEYLLRSFNVGDKKVDLNSALNTEGAKFLLTMVNDQEEEKPQLQISLPETQDAPEVTLKYNFKAPEKDVEDPDSNYVIQEPDDATEQVTTVPETEEVPTAPEAETSTPEAATSTPEVIIVEPTSVPTEQGTSAPITVAPSDQPTGSSTMLPLGVTQAPPEEEKKDEEGGNPTDSVVIIPQPSDKTETGAEAPTVGSIRKEQPQIKENNSVEVLTTDQVINFNIYDADGISVSDVNKSSKDSGDKDFPKTWTIQFKLDGRKAPYTITYICSINGNTEELEEQLIGP